MMEKPQKMKGVSMQSQIASRSLLALPKAVAASIVLGFHLALAWPACAALESGTYQTLPGATVEERGDRVPNGSRVVPLSATLKFDLGEIGRASCRERVEVE